MNRNRNSNALANTAPVRKVVKALKSYAAAQISGNPQRQQAALTRLENVSKEADYKLALDTALNRPK